MDEYTISIARVADVSVFDSNGNVVQKKRVTFNVGRNGPFVLDYSTSDYTADRVKQDMQKEQEILRAIHATPGS